MDTFDRMRDALDYIENNLAGEIDNREVARIALCSEYHFQRMFLFLIGVPPSEYIRRRRLTLAAFDLQRENERVLDIALRYGYTSADAFTRAFRALHGITPSEARERGAALKAYPRVSFTLSLKGATDMTYRIEDKPGFHILGITERLSYLGDLGAEVGRMWGDFSGEIAERILALGDSPPGGLVGAYAGMHEDHTTDYYIGVLGRQPCPDGLSQLDVPAGTWAVFTIKGPLSGAMREVWGRIFSEWFPISRYEHAPLPEIEWYSEGDMGGPDYLSEIWIPVVQKE